MRKKKVRKTDPKKGGAKESPVILHDYPSRLTELEVELCRHLARTEKDRPLKSIQDPTPGEILGQRLMEFSFGNHSYAVGHSDLTFSDSNHARGVRQIRFYAEGKMVLDIEGDFENQQFGDNFRFQNIDCYIPGTWEADFLALSEELRHHADNRKKAFQKMRASNRRPKISPNDI